MTTPDRFGAAALREATVAAWRDSPTRLAEDAAAEADLATVGYRDRLVVELVTNAADAAHLGGVAGHVAIWADGATLHIANTGAPLTESGVRSLTALRVSAKDPAGTDGVVGRFGVGFSATATVADRVEIRSGPGSIVFDRDRTGATLEQAGIDADEALSRHAVPLLRLAWPLDAAPRAGFATEIVLSLRPDTDVAGLLAVAAGQAADLLLALPALARMDVGEQTFTVERGDDRIVVEESGGGRREFAVATHGGSRWSVELRQGTVVVGDRDVVWAPTPTDIPMSLPCRLYTDAPLTADRRHLHPSADIVGAAAGYPEILRLVDPVDRLSLVPLPYRAHGGDDTRMIEAVLAALRTSGWLPGAGGDDLVPTRAVVLIGLSDALAEVLGEVFADLVHPELSSAYRLPVLELLGVDRIGLAVVAERLAGVDRDAQWWHRLYDALAPLVGTGADVEELAALPIPRSDSRMHIGARGLFTTTVDVGIPLRWVPTVDPAADHPLLERLGVQTLSPAEALADPVLQSLVDDEAEDLAEEVLTLLAADPDAPVPGWLARLPIPDADGELCSADELLLAESPLLSVLVDDHPFGIVDPELAERVGADVLRRLGVGWGFALVSDELPVGPDHELPDEEQWWESLPDAPETLCAIRDLDLVDPDRWASALTLMATDERLAPAFTGRADYTPWWLRHFAEVDGSLLGEFRAPSDAGLAGVLDPLDHPHADDLATALGALPPESATDASVLLARLGEDGRDVTPGVAVGIHAAIVGACRSGALDPADIDVPQSVRTLSGGVADDAVVVDAPWWLQTLDDAEAVIAGLPVVAADAAMLAEILDLPTAGEQFTVILGGPGRPVETTSAEAVRWSATAGAVAGPMRIHDELWVFLEHNGTRREKRVDWWVDDRGVTHRGQVS
ncbi:ATP-binding protein [Gordonia sp. NB41Y]|uniref:sacsin N-terminal ATP-binding-like domain-containing protein n=1 Tax=Gordonia sp. NB41Y TaxID=875808 RepID=UPI0006B16798|nr:ATP-binding protein [Gordonia sp. NB41Y]KOY48915.1 hypothetical protein ISGA_13475 [Gordonia sp. NB41Y]WLP93176.1 ATP-binding protein [Gordonia sp. NB41Y]